MKSSYSQTTTFADGTPLRSPAELRRRMDRLAGSRDEKLRRKKSVDKNLADVRQYLKLAEPVTEALKGLGEQLFESELRIVEEKLSHALKDVLEQPVSFKATAGFKSGAAVVDFSIERQGNREDVQRGQGGSVQNILSVGLRIFALATLEPNEHRPFLVLDEQDCWLRPELVPRLVRIVEAASRELGFQVLMISHHNLALFDQFADQIISLEPAGKNRDSVNIKIAKRRAMIEDSDLA